MAIHHDHSGAVYAFFAGESTPKLDSLQEKTQSADPEWILNRLEKIQPEDCGLDRATFNEVNRALRVELAEMMQ